MNIYDHILPFIQNSLLVLDLIVGKNINEIRQELQPSIKKPLAHVNTNITKYCITFTLRPNDSTIIYTLADLI